MITGKYLENPALYSPDELERLDNHIEKYFGKATTVVHEFFSEDIHVDVSIIPPHEEHNYYTLVTTGMGAFSMKIPSEYQEDGLPSRIELMMCLPPEWNPESKESQENWPVELLRYLARFATVYKGNIIKNLIMDCQSYTKYRPNETMGGIFVSWRRKEELPTGA